MSFRWVSMYPLMSLLLPSSARLREDHQSIHVGEPQVPLHQLLSVLLHEASHQVEVFIRSGPHLARNLTLEKGLRSIGAPEIPGME